MSTDLGTFSAPDAGNLAGLAGNSALLFVNALNIYPHSAWSLVAELDHSLRTSLHAGSAGSTFLLVNYRKTCRRIHRNGSESTGGNTVPAAQAAVKAARVTTVESRLHTAGGITAILVGARTVLTSSVATNYSHHRGLLPDLHTKDGCNLFHGLVSSHRTEIVVKTGSSDTRSGKSVTTGVTATSTVGSRQHLLHLFDSRIFLHLEFLCHKIEDDRKQYAQKGDYCNGPNNCLCHKN